MSVKILAIARTTENLFPFIKSFLSFDSVSFSFTICLNFSWIRELTIQNYTATTHTDVSNPFPGWVFVSLIDWQILINRTIFLRKRKNVWDAQSFNMGTCIILTSFHATYYKMEGHTYKFISADDVSNEITIGLFNRRKIYASWDGQYHVNLWLGCSLERHMSDVESLFLLFFHLIMFLWIFFSLCIVSIHTFWCLVSDWWIGGLVKRFPINQMLEFGFLLKKFN